MLKKVLVLLSVFFIVGAWLWPILVKTFSNDDHRKTIEQKTESTNLLEEDVHNVQNKEVSHPSKEASQSNHQKVRINEATISELMEISGVGEELAKKIKQELSQNGPFHKNDDLLRVNGIGEKKLKKIAAYIEV